MDGLKKNAPLQSQRKNSESYWKRSCFKAPVIMRNSDSVNDIGLNVEAFEISNLTIRPALGRNRELESLSLPRSHSSICTVGLDEAFLRLFNSHISKYQLQVFTVSLVILANKNSNREFENMKLAYTGTGIMQASCRGRVDSQGNDLRDRVPSRRADSCFLSTSGLVGPENRLPTYRICLHRTCD